MHSVSSRQRAPHPAHAAPVARRPLAMASGLLLALLAGCGQEPAGGAGGGKGKDGPARVVTTAAASRPYAQAITGIATLRARESVLVTAAAAGRVREILFREGTTVTTGTPLVRLEDDTERAEHQAARVNAELQAVRFARVQELLQRGLVSRDEHDAQSQTLREAQSREELARVRLDLRTVRAPFAGILGFRQVSPGALVQPGDAIVSLDAVDTLRADFTVPETLLGVLATGVAVSGQAAAFPGRAFAGRITLLGTRVDEATRALTVQALIDNRDGRLKPGMLLTLAVPARERQALFVPEAALVPENARQYVWRVGADGSAARVEVTPGVRADGAVEIVAGLAAGDRVVTAGQGNLRDGRPVVESGAAPAGKAP